jgi:hypothetical protein
MRIPLPPTPRWFGRYLDWVNEPIWQRGKLELRRIDVVIALGGITCVAWYTHTGGWQGGLTGAAMYLLGAMVALWIL